MPDADATAIYASAHIGGPLERGIKPGALVVDFQTGFTQPASPVGSEMTEQILATRMLLDVCRKAGAPIIFTVIAYEQPDDVGVWAKKMPGLQALLSDGPWTRIDERLARQGDEPIVAKRGASALFNTDVADRFRASGVDTVLLMGATTSGCVRASAVDLLQTNFVVLVPRECCADRAAGPHEANLFDMASKYADVISVADAVDYVKAVSKSSSG